MALAKAGAEEEGTDAGTSMPEGTAEAARGEGEEARASPPAATQGQTSRASPPPDAQRQTTPSPDSLEARLARMEELQNRSMNTIIPILTRAVDGMRLDARIQSEGRSPGGRRQSAGTPGQDESLEAPADGSSPTRGRHTDARPGSDGTRLRDSRRDEMFRLSSVPLIETPVRVQEPESRYPWTRPAFLPSTCHSPWPYTPTPGSTLARQSTIRTRASLHAHFRVDKRARLHNHLQRGMRLQRTH